MKSLSYYYMDLLELELEMVSTLCAYTYVSSFHVIIFLVFFPNYVQALSRTT